MMTYEEAKRVWEFVNWEVFGAVPNDFYIASAYQKGSYAKDNFEIETEKILQDILSVADGKPPIYYKR